MSEFAELERRQCPAMAAIQSEVSAGVVDGMRAVFADKESMQAFWSVGYDALAIHAADGASKWLGRRILTWFVTAAFTAAAIYLLAQGALPGLKK